MNVAIQCLYWKCKYINYNHFYLNLKIVSKRQDAKKQVGFIRYDINKRKCDIKNPIKEEQIIFQNFKHDEQSEVISFWELNFFIFNNHFCFIKGN